MSTYLNVRAKQCSRIKKELALWLVFALPLVATVAWSQQQETSSGSFFGNGGPWMAVANTPDCSALGRVCAEWPFQSNGQEFLAVCCIVPSDLGSAKPPDDACAEGGMLMFRRRDSVGDSW